jgi:hypothetical protein
MSTLKSSIPLWLLMMYAWGTCCAAGEILFQDDFEDGNLDGWSVIGGELSEWIVEDGTCRRLVTGLPSLNSSVIIAGTDSWTDYRAEFDMRRLQGNQIYVVFRYTPEGDYRLYSPDLVQPEGTIGLRDAGFRSLCSESSFVTENGTWYHWAVECRGNLVTVFVNGSKILECLDEANSAPSGAFAPGVYVGAGAVCEVEYDNVVVTALDPGPTVTPTSPSPPSHIIIH